jgi:amino acid transporter
LVLSGVAASGLRPSALVWSGITLLKLLPLVVLASLFLLSAPLTGPVEVVSGSDAELWRAALVVVFALQGFEIVPVPAGHTRKSALAIPAATLGSLFCAAALYVALHAACVRALPNLAATPSPLVAAGAAYGGPGMARLLAIGTNLSALGIAFGMFAMTPRYLAALGSADAFGNWVCREDTRRVPQRALWITAGAVLTCVMASGLAQLFVLSSVAVLTQYAVSAASLVVLALRRKHGLGPHLLWPAPLALVSIVLVGRAARAKELLTAAAVLALGGALLWARRRVGETRGPGAV